MNVYKKRKDSQKNIASERIKELITQSQAIFPKENKLADKYVQMAKSISMKYKVPFNKSQKLKYCKKCSSFLVPGNNARIRVQRGKIRVLCLKCKNIMRYIYK